ncbi:Ig-like domain-containing protein [Myroides pelagicus]|uniref:Ig-like domain-containing protein n=1 Tax=Myroides pelagicus TaxID=270914 RepID=UPI002DBCD8C6|nr:Ig-like domain-containing protein [Myroides pelagicus]MEC4112716.1 Ig-like domain-containing protein [Myroides pelagicus]
MSKFRIYFIFCFLVLSALSLSNCAKRGYITGGPQDTIPPVVLRSTPANFTTNFKENIIYIDFDEFIKVNKLNQNLIISPPLENTPEVSPMGSAKKRITIRLRDTLKENTTYSFNFGDAIIDNNEGNVLKQFKYIFSTGDYIDSLKIKGSISSINQIKADNFVNIMLYDAKTFNDSTVYKEKPLYITNTLDSLTDFTVDNIKEGSYYIIALKDKNNNYLFDPKQDKIGFIKDPITIPSDQVHKIVLFKSNEKLETSRPSQVSKNKWYLPFFGDVEDAIVTVAKNDSLIRSTYTALAQKDSLQVWFPEVKADSLYINVKKEDYNKTYTVKPRVKIDAIDSLSISATNSILHYVNDFTINTTTPIEKINQTLITVLNKDSVAIPYEVDHKKLEQRILLKFNKEENANYYINLMPNALTDFFGKTNDTLNYEVKTAPYSDYGNLFLKFTGIKRYPIIVEIVDEKENVIASQYSEQESDFNFLLLSPRKYYVRIIYDDNKNKKWDSGYYWEKTQPEEVIYFPELIDVRANWDIQQDINFEK